MLSLSTKFINIGQKKKKQQLRVVIINRSSTSQDYLIQYAEIVIMNALILNTFFAVTTAIDKTL